MEIKYEPVFGDQSLFDDAPIEATHAAQGGGFYRATDGGGVQYLSRGPLNGDMCNFIDGYLIAERRIVAEPKRWTLEDKKAGRLPEVGAEYAVSGCIVEHLGVGTLYNSQNFYFKYSSGECSNAGQRFVKPIETPEEKAARVREEWCIKALGLNSKSGSKVDAIYDAMLSGDLPVPDKE